MSFGVASIFGPLQCLVNSNSSRRAAMLTLSDPAPASVASSLANALAENGQVGSRNISNRRGPCPQVSGSARQVLIVSVMQSSSFGVSSYQPSIAGDGQPGAPHTTSSSVGVPGPLARLAHLGATQLLSAPRLRQQ